MTEKKEIVKLWDLVSWIKTEWWIIQIATDTFMSLYQKLENIGCDKVSKENFENNKSVDFRSCIPYYMIPRFDSSKSGLCDRCKHKESSIHSIHACKLLVNKGMYFEQDNYKWIVSYSRRHHSHYVRESKVGSACIKLITKK